MAETLTQRVFRVLPILSLAFIGFWLIFRDGDLEPLLDPSAEWLMGMIFTMIFILAMALALNRGFGFVFATCITVPPLTHAWHVLFGEASIAQYGGSDFFSIFSIDTADWLISDPEGIGLGGALLNTYEFTVAFSLLALYAFAALTYNSEPEEIVGIGFVNWNRLGGVSIMLGLIGIIQFVIYGFLAPANNLEDMFLIDSFFTIGSSFVWVLLVFLNQERF